MNLFDTAKITDFTSYYHHGCGVKNILAQDPSICWFSSASAPLPQHVDFEFEQPSKISKVGLFLHGENNQNPQVIRFYVKCDGKWEILTEQRLDQRPGEWVFDVKGYGYEIRYEILENYGGSGAYTTLLFAYE